MSSMAIRVGWAVKGARHRNQARTDANSATVQDAENATVQMYWSQTFKWDEQTEWLVE